MMKRLLTVSGIVLGLGLTTAFAQEAPKPPVSKPQNVYEFLSPSAMAERVNRERTEWQTYLRSHRYARSLAEASFEARKIVQQSDYTLTGLITVSQPHGPENPISAMYCDGAVLAWYANEILFGFKGQDQEHLMDGLLEVHQTAYAYTKKGGADLVRYDGTLFTPPAPCAATIPEGRTVYAVPFVKPEVNERLLPGKEVEWRETCPANHYGKQRWVREYVLNTRTDLKEYSEDWRVDLDRCFPWQTRKEVETVQYTIKKTIAGVERDWDCVDFYERTGTFKGFDEPIIWGPFRLVSSTCDGVENRPALVLDNHSRDDVFLRSETETASKTCPSPYSGSVSYQRLVNYYRSTMADGSVKNNLPRYGSWSVYNLDCTQWEYRNVSCPSGYSGSIKQRRLITLQNMEGETTTSGWSTYKKTCKKKVRCYKWTTSSAHNDWTHCKCMTSPPTSGSGYRIVSSCNGGGGSGHDHDGDHDGDGRNDGSQGDGSRGGGPNGGGGN